MLVQRKRTKRKDALSVGIFVLLPESQNRSQIPKLGPRLPKFLTEFALYANDRFFRPWRKWVFKPHFPPNHSTEAPSREIRTKDKPSLNKGLVCMD
ncbi:hypothetical protein BKM32_03420 [Mangrovimonas sp. DI 80]|nr:hypothetical protein BKM32_03420 [Mangrovimonas sp. DI 80]